MNTRWHDLSVERLEDGGIHLEQQYLEPSVIHLHPQQLRHVAEQFGLVAPNYPDDELSKRLAEQLCRVYLEMHDDYRHLSDKLESALDRLGGFIDGIPDSIFPNHLWEQREERERKKEEERLQKAAKETVPFFPPTSTENGAVQKTGDSIDSDGQLGLPV